MICIIFRIKRMLMFRAGTPTQHHCFIYLFATKTCKRSPTIFHSRNGIVYRFVMLFFPTQQECIFHFILLLPRISYV